MDHIVHRVLRFDRFALDLTRGCLRTGDQDVDLRPKAFEVLCYLAENAERLVSKQELYDAAWPNVTVCDDSLVQCIRELRHKLGDDDHRLIKTVSRRGYLLDATVSAQAPQSLSDGSAVTPSEGPQKLATKLDVPRRVLSTIPAHKLRMWGAIAAGLMCVALGAIYLRGWPTPVAKPGHVSLAKNAPAALQSRPTFKDCTDCPEMVALSAGEFVMGSPGDDPWREQSEEPPRRVVIKKPIAIGRFEVTVDQFSAFVAETGMTAGNLCRAIVGSTGNYFIWGPPEASFRQPGFAVTGTHPVVCISWHEAQAYVAWLRRRTGRPYRLPTEAEWEYAARAGTRTIYSFGDDPAALCVYGRFADLGSSFPWRGGCRSDTATDGPIPVGQLKPNPWGIFDMHGNAWEWVEDCWTPTALEIPPDGSAFSRPGTCELVVVRGGSWAIGFQRLRSATRVRHLAASHYPHIGFRVALSLDD
jgi:formylglycine-generating enzyme required for sulfatase activity